ncbi:LysR family transcriptional regulator [Bosea caraganae]|uniref:LysR family transcriptional regulator n=1 Tax=Bosea caraganae TaxID=2763117 RepID=A0A370L7X5_9HYPH|nr:LysR family transcriptional regulator [Bosea caraganae]RDJ25037.1 LysR family transcriptional regulator [Bosea caraganae]RDJ26147.1 LysR family transcriptional regulator [Bosea caraganae]
MAFDGRLLAGVSVLAAVVEGGSFVRAAEALGMSDSGVSRAIARLEKRVGIRLIDRTTRSMTLTDEGRRFHERVAPMLGGIEEAAIEASGSAGAVRGRLRVDLDPFFARLLLADRLGAFLEEHPELSLELVTRAHVGDLIADGIDLAMRFGEPSPSSAVARKLLETRILTVASPGYLARHGRPTHPSELARHACIHYRDPVTGRPFDWEFHRDGEVLSVEAPGRLLLSDVGTMHAACVAGAGVAQVMALGSQHLLDEGRLVELFPDWPGEVFPLYALYPSRHQPAAKVRAFIEFALAETRRG